MTTNVFCLLRRCENKFWHFKQIRCMLTFPTTSHGCHLLTRNNYLLPKVDTGVEYQYKSIVPRIFYSVRHENNSQLPNLEPTEKKPGIFKRFKQMYRDYWYVLVPVHLVTSIAWFGSFYYLATSGVDLVTFVESLNISDSLVEKLKRGGNTTAGYLALSYALYKIFTPLRYTVTLGGTTFAINYLTKRGFLQPMPKKEEIRRILQNKKESLKEKKETVKSNLIIRFTQKKR